MVQVGTTFAGFASKFLMVLKKQTTLHLHAFNIEVFRDTDIKHHKYKK